jgi:hypothetical protein
MVGKHQWKSGSKFEDLVLVTHWLSVLVLSGLTISALLGLSVLVLSGLTISVLLGLPVLVLSGLTISVLLGLSVLVLSREDRQSSQ